VAAYELQTGRIGPPVKGQNEWFIIEVVDRVPGKPSELAEQRVEILQWLRQNNASRFLALWYDDLRKEADIVDLRERTLN
jgi:parvulin-like peptidyl-prolyl isomerase